MDITDTEIEAANTILSQVIDGETDAAGLIAAAGQLVPVYAGFCVVNRRRLRPIHLCDTYSDGAAKQAVQLYVNQTYLLNPFYNAYLAGLAPGVHRMADLAPDDWQPGTDGPRVLAEDNEEIGYRTPGWPRGLQELSIAVALPDGAMGEISLARPANEGGFTSDHLRRLRLFYPLLAAAFRSLRRDLSTVAEGRPAQRLEDFGRGVLSPREAQIVQMVLKGHSSQSIGLSLGIALPTVKTHRRNAYHRLGVSTQQQLFNAFLSWQADS